MSYTDQTAPVRVTIGDGADDGTAFEDDFVASDIERVFGGSGTDVLVGDEGNDLLDGGPGFDTADYAASSPATVTIGRGANDGNVVGAE